MILLSTVPTPIDTLNPKPQNPEKIRASAVGGVSFGARFQHGSKALVPFDLLVGYHGELKVSLFHNTRIQGLYRDYVA